MKYNKKGLLVLALSLSTLMGCQREDVVATVGSADITSQQFNAYLKHKRLPSDDVMVANRALNELVVRESLAQAIEAEGELKQEEIEAELAELRRQILINNYFERYLDKRITDDIVRSYYANNVDKYESNRAKVAHILIRTNSRMSETERQARLTLAREVHSKLGSGEGFSQLALEYSEDKVSGKKGGDLGWLAEGAISPEFSAKAFALEVGKYSEPFMTSYGFHIVKLVEGPQISRKPLEAVESQIRYQLRKEAKQAEMERLQSKIKVSQKKLEAKSA